MPQTKQPTIVSKSGGWAHFLVKWVIAAVAVILTTVGTVNLVKTIYKSSLPKYPVDSFRLDISRPSVAPESNQTKAPELTEEQKKQTQEREDEQRNLAKINDFAAAFAELLAGLGLWFVFRLIVKREE